MDTTIAQLIDPTIAQFADSTIRQIIDSTTAQLIDSITAQVIEKTESTWLKKTIITAIIAGIVGFSLWLYQNWREGKQKARSEHEHFVKVWGLALFELREAISRSISYSDRLNKGEVSLGVLYFSKTLSSDYFKSSSDLSVASKMHWLYAMLNQIQENLRTSRLTDEVTRAKLGDTMYYAQAAAGFSSSHKDELISKFNYCLQALREFCIKQDITIVPILGMLEQLKDESQ